MEAVMIKNVHERRLPVDAGPFVDRILELWPAGWPPMEFDRPLEVGADGGHGSIRYTCTAYERGRRIEFAFKHLNGTHALEADGNTLRHTLVTHPASPLPWARWTFVIRWLHDACLEELLDNAETAAGRPPRRPSRRSPFVRLLMRIAGLPARQTSATEGSIGN
jgi:hypothetical protein